MPQYKGFQNEDIVASIEAAKVFVKELGCDMIIQTAFDQITSQDLTSIRNAPSDESLRKAAKKIEHVFVFTRDLFLTHGALNTNGDGARVASALYAWGAFDGARALAEYEIDRAKEAFINLDDT